MQEQPWHHYWDWDFRTSIVLMIFRPNQVSNQNKRSFSTLRLHWTASATLQPQPGQKPEGCQSGRPWVIMSHQDILWVALFSSWFTRQPDDSWRFHTSHLCQRLFSSLMANQDKLAASTQVHLHLRSLLRPIYYCWIWSNNSFSYVIIYIYIIYIYIAFSLLPHFQ